MAAGVDAYQMHQEIRAAAPLGAREGIYLFAVVTAAGRG